MYCSGNITSSSAAAAAADDDDGDDVHRYSSDTIQVSSRSSRVSTLYRLAKYDTGAEVSPGMYCFDKIKCKRVFVVYTEKVQYTAS